MVGEDLTDQTGMSELLMRHRPLLKFDAQEPYLAIAAESIACNPGNRLILEDETKLAEVDEHGGGLSLELLSDYSNPHSPRSGDRFDEVCQDGADLVDDARRLQADSRFAERAYGRAIRDGEWLWLQYWFWEYYNPKHLLGFGKHEGDWELVQVGLDAQDTPRVVTYAQHNGGAGRSWDEIELEQRADGLHPVVYVAPFSHASYFEARTHWHPGGPDSPDGEGPTYLPKIEHFGAWATWPGRWGNSSGVLATLSGGRLGGRSPSGPGAQRGRWERPSEFHRQTERKRLFGHVDRAIWWLGRHTYPFAPRLDQLTLRGTELSGDYSVERNLLRWATQLHLTAHDADKDDQPILASTTIKISRGGGHFELTLPRAVDHCLIRATAFNIFRQRSNPTEVDVEQS